MKKRVTAFVLTLIILVSALPLSALAASSVYISSQPTSVTVANGSTATVKVTAVGTGLTYKWYWAAAGSSSFKYTSTFKSNTYSVPMNSSRAGRQVYCVITDTYGNSVRSNTVTLNMSGMAKITSQPQSVSVAGGATATVSLRATGDGLTYNWYYANKGSNTFKYTSTFKGNTYSAEMNGSRNGRKVYCVVTDKYGNSVKSNTVTISQSNAVSILIQPDHSGVNKGQTASTYLYASGEGLTYKWYYANEGSSSFTYTSTFKSNSYSVQMNEARCGRRVYCVVTDKWGNSVKSKVVTLYAHDRKISKDYTKVYCREGDTAGFNVYVSPAGGTYKWYYANKGSSTWKYTSTFKGSEYSLVMTSARDGRKVYCKYTTPYGTTVKSHIVTFVMLK